MRRSTSKTVKWKSEEVQKLASEYKNVVFIDDEENNRQAVDALELPNVICFASFEHWEGMDA